MNPQQRPLSVFVILGLKGAFIYACATLVIFWFSVQMSYVSWVESTGKKIETHSNSYSAEISRAEIGLGREASDVSSDEEIQKTLRNVQKFLDDLVNAHEIAYYFIAENGHVVAYGNILHEDPNLSYQQRSQPGWYYDIARRELVSNTRQHQLVLGQKISRWVFTFEQYRIALGLILGSVIACYFSLGYLIFRESRNLRTLIDWMVKPGKAGLNQQVLDSAEAQKIYGTLRSLRELNQNLSQKYHLLERQIPPAELLELQVAKDSWYAFDCTVVVIDLNGYTAISNSAKKRELFESVNLFTGISRVIFHKYRALYKEQKGDGWIFYVKHDGTPDASKRAVLGLREVLESAEEIHRSCVENGFSFRLKSSISQGKLRCDRDSQGKINIGGEAITYCTRMLENVDEKDKQKNLVYLDKSTAEAVSDVVQTQFAKDAVLKGYTGLHSLYEMQSAIPVTQQLENCLAPSAGSETAKLVSVYRKAEEVHEIIRWIDRNWAGVPIEITMTLLGRIQEFDLVPTSVSVSQAVRDLISTLKMAYLAHQNSFSGTASDQIDVSGKRRSDEVFSSAELVLNLVAAVIPQLFSDSSSRSEGIGLLRELQSEGFPARTVANAIEAAERLNTGSVWDSLEGTAIHRNNRTLANAVVALAETDWDFAVATLRDMLSSKDARVNSSGFYALAKICERLRIERPDILRTNEDIQKFVQLTKRLIESPDSDANVVRHAERVLSVYRLSEQ